VELTGVTVIDDHTLDVRFDEAEVLFPIFPIFILDRGIVSEHGAGWASEVSAGTGPFRFAEWRRGQVVKLARHENYWGGAAAIDGVDFVIVPTDDTAVSMYETGELDLAYVEPPTTRRVLEDDAFASERVTIPAAQIQYLGMNQNLYEPFRDIRVREAVCLSLDLEALSEGLFHGAARPLAGQVTAGVAGFNPELEPVPFDPDRAKRLLVEAGYPEGKGMPPVRISSTEPNRLELAYFAEQLKSVLGMPVEVEVVERGTHLSAMNAGQVAFFPWAWSAAYPDGLYFLRDVWYGPSVYNRSRWQNDRFDALIERASETAGAEARYALYHEAEKVLLSDWGTCPTVVRLQVALVKPYVKGAELTAFRFLPFADVSMEPH
ncbi:MAG: ABC transporter substrate-binding protein, partial [Acidobacteriota bacterium]|nr:ABC transporter substrate-binding protein [Acidobacteriota bacterium]